MSLEIDRKPYTVDVYLVGLTPGLIITDLLFNDVRQVAYVQNISLLSIVATTECKNAKIVAGALTTLRFFVDGKIIATEKPIRLGTSEVVTSTLCSLYRIITSTFMLPRLRRLNCSH